MDFRGFVEFIKDIIGYIITFFVLIFIFAFVVAFHPVAGNSMTPNLSEGDITVVSKITPLFSKFKRFDIAIVKDKDKKYYMKRIIGVPGEKVDYQNNNLYINDIVVDEEFLTDKTKTDSFKFEDICSKEVCQDGVIPENYYLVLGDNRADSYDSRDPELGLVPKSQLKGKILLRIWPIEDFGTIK